MFTATFYSYKGGVGRTLALMNVAFRLSAKGKSVFVLDFDLEAPGLLTFMPGADLANASGLLDYIDYYCKHEQMAALEQHVMQVPLPPKSPGKIYLMPAGREDRDYQAHLASLDWREFYSRKEGFLFVENLKAAINSIYKPDYLLVDSRTGLTDISGICTLQLPDLVVLLFGLNEQNLQGICRIYQSIKHNTINRQIDTLLVASPVPDIPEYLGIKQERLNRAKQLCGSSVDIVLPYNPFVAFQEVLFREFSSDFLGKAYDELTAAIIKRNRSDLTHLLQEARRSSQTTDIEIATQKYKQLIDENPGNVDVLTEFGTFLRSSGRYGEALSILQQAIQLDGSVKAFGQAAAALLALGRGSEAEEVWSEYLERSNDPGEIWALASVFESKGEILGAIKGYERLAQLQNIDSESAHLSNLARGILFLRLGRPHDAIGVLQEYLNRAPSDLTGVYNMGYAQLQCGNKVEAGLYFGKAIEVFEQQQQKRTPVLQANVSQAMSRAYAFLGKTERAKELLNESIMVAEGLRHSDIFSSAKYKDVPAQEFIADTRQLLRDLEAHGNTTETADQERALERPN